MKLFLFSAVLASFATNVFAQVPAGSSGSDLQALWNMANPTISYATSTNTYTLSVDVDDRFKTFTSADNFRVKSYDNFNCKINDEGAGEFSAGLSGISTNVIGDDGSKKLETKFQVEPAVITKNTEIYDSGSGALKFCIRNSVGYTDSAFNEVNFIESLLTINYSLDGTFSVVKIDVAPKAKQTDSQTEDAYGLTAYLCDITPTGETETISGVTVPKEKTATFNQGSLITVCVRPVADAYAEGIVMDYIKDFTWKRDGSVEGADTTIEVQQPAITEKAAAGNLLTYYPGCSGSDYCYFSSILFADFQISTGKAEGSGSARTKFKTRRRLNENDEGRALQEAGPADGDSAFDIAIGIEATDEGPGALKTAGGVSLRFTALASVMALAGSVFFF